MFNLKKKCYQYIMSDLSIPDLIVEAEPVNVYTIKNG